MIANTFTRKFSYELTRKLMSHFSVLTGNVSGGTASTIKDFDGRQDFIAGRTKFSWEIVNLSTKIVVEILWLSLDCVR